MHMRKMSTMAAAGQRKNSHSIIYEFPMTWNFKELSFSLEAVGLDALQRGRVEAWWVSCKIVHRRLRANAVLSIKSKQLKDDKN